jgi:hypothetical protein
MPWYGMHRFANFLACEEHRNVERNKEPVKCSTAARLHGPIEEMEFAFAGIALLCPPTYYYPT